MATNREVDAARYNTLEAILTRIDSLVPAAGSEGESRMILNLAEAFAWLWVPNNAHGGSGGVKPAQ